MNRNIILALAAVIIIIIGVLLFTQNRDVSEDAVDTRNNNNGSVVTSAADTELKAMITEFGARMKNVSLASPKASYATQIDTQYKEFLTPELLQAWKNDPKIALGRNVSSPWPERIEVVAVTQEGEQYIVSGNVIEITSADEPMEPSGVYPVTFTIERINDEWFISKAEKGPYSEIPTRRTVKGVWECLPHKDTTGPQTMECAFGIKEGNKHYAVSMTLLSSGPIDFATGTEVQAEGVFVPIANISSDIWQKYPIEGIISVTSIKKI